MAVDWATWETAPGENAQSIENASNCQRDGLVVSFGATAARLSRIKYSGLFTIPRNGYFV